MKLQHKILIIGGIFTVLMAYCWAVTFAASMFQAPPAVIVFLLAVVVLVWHRVEEAGK